MALLDFLVALKWPLIIIQGFISLLLIILILLQQGRGDDMASALSGSVGSKVQGTGGQSKFLVKGTVVLAVLFMVNSIVLAKVFKHLGTASVGATVSEPLVPQDELPVNAVGSKASAPEGKAETPQGQSQDSNPKPVKAKPVKK